MPRKPREEMAGGVYHVYARGNRREPIFRDEDDRHAYLQIFGDVAVEMGWRPLAYALMTNHVHHLIELTEPNLGAGIRWAHGLYAKLFNERHQTGGGHLFEKRFGSTRARTSGALWYFASYVVLNPVSAGMCALPEDYPWSSHAPAIGDAVGPAWLDVARLMWHFESLDRYRQIVEAIRIMGAAGFEPATSRV